MKNIYILLLPLIFIFGCKDAEPDAREFPIILTNSPTDVDETGATFQGRLISEGKLPTTSYGFVWGIKDQTVEIANRISIDENPGATKFAIRIDHALAKDVEYKIRAFATSENTTVYGNTISFISKGSTQNGWTILNSNAKNIYGYVAYSFSDGEFGYRLNHTKMVRFDPSTYQISDYTDFPASGGDFTNYTVVGLGRDQYFFSSLSNWLYRLSNGKWNTQSGIPFPYWEFGYYYQGLSANNKIYILSSYESYMYDPNSDTWEHKARLPIEGGYSNAGTTLNGKAYVITSDKNLWEYDPVTDKWSLKSQYPGILGDRLVSFSYNSKLYFGISTTRKEANMLVDKRLWSLDLASNKWIMVEEFPADHDYGGLFYFFIKDNLYVGMENSGNSYNYTLWKYDPSK